MAHVERDVQISQCRACGQIERDGESTCCGERMETVETTVAFESPEVETVAREVFGATARELEICDVLMTEGEASVSTLTEHFSCDRSTISRHLNHLVERGIVTKRSMDLEGGGRVHMYSTVLPDELRRKVKVGLYQWAEEAMEEMDEHIQSKIESAEQTDGVRTGGSDGNTTSRPMGGAHNDSAGANASTQERSLLEKLFDHV